jgi:hypothetical protein
MDEARIQELEDAAKRQANTAMHLSANEVMEIVAGLRLFNEFKKRWLELEKLYQCKFHIN